MIFDEQESKAHTPTGSRHEQRKKKHGATKIKRREASGQHPTLEELSSSDSDVDPNSDEDRSTASGDDLDPEDQPPGTVRKVASGNGFALNELLALEADDGQGNKEEEEEGEGSVDSDYVQIEDEDIFNETALQLPPKCHLHPVGALRIQGKADWHEQKNGSLGCIYKDVYFRPQMQ